MIHFFVTGEHSYTVEPFLETWPHPLGRTFQIVPHENVPLITRLTPGLFIFTDLDRLTGPQRNNIHRLGDLIASKFGPRLILNPPRQFLGRADLLRLLHQQGINRFRVFTVGEPLDAMRFPVFIRNPHDHEGSLTPILHTRAEYDAALARLLVKGKPPEQLLTIEFCDTRMPDGLYRKFSAFRIGDRIIPGHILYSPDWVTKNSGPEPIREEERAYLADNPHREQLLHLFDLAGITFGRIDYALLDGKIQVWEINTNPMLIQEREKYAPDKLPFKQLLVDQVAAAMLDLHEEAKMVSHPPIRLWLSFFDTASLSLRDRFKRFFCGVKL